jgi:hypothetical protein
MYDLSDRQLEREWRFNIAYKWFCGFTAFEKTPDHSYFGRFRNRIGTKGIGKLFSLILGLRKITDKSDDVDSISPVWLGLVNETITFSRSDAEVPTELMVA